MVYLEILKLIAEVITATATAIVMIAYLVRFTFKLIQRKSDSQHKGG